jgi:hypothetical protein
MTVITNATAYAEITQTGTYGRKAKVVRIEPR